MKKMIQKEMSMCRYILYMSAIMLMLCSLVFLLYSCDQDGSIAESGEKVTVRFVLSGDSHTDEMRSRGALESETVMFPVSDDFYLSATLEELPEVTVRANVNLGDGNKVWIGAYTGTPSVATLVDSATYIVTGTSIVPACSSELEVTSGQSYTFVAWSYKTTAGIAVPGSGTVSNINPSVDATKNLMWCKTAPSTITSEHRSVALVLQHKFPTVQLRFSSIKYDGQPALSNITGVTFEPNCLANLEVATGTLTAAGPAPDVNSTFSTWNYPSNMDTIATSSVLTVNPGGNSTLTVTVGSIQFGAETFSDVALTFPMSLDPRKAYIITLRQQRPAAAATGGVKFAASNIYWVSTGLATGYLSFDRYTPTPTDASMQKQGVFFKWGSLIGISSGGPGAVSTSWGNDTTVYVPMDAVHWTKKKASEARKTYWSGNTNTSEYVNIPYAQGGDYTTAGSLRANNYLTSVVGVGGTKDSTAFYKGDICKFLDNRYRMPRSEEFGDISNYVKYSFSGYVATANDGTSQILRNRGVQYTPSGSSTAWFFPASGGRTAAALLYLGTSGTYWSSSAYSNMLSYELMLSAGAVSPSGMESRSYGFSVRCVLN